MRVMWRVWLGWMLTIGCAIAQTLTPNDVVPGEILLTMHAGTPIEKARAIAAQIQAELIPISVPDTYILRVSHPQATPAELLSIVQRKVDQIKSHPDVRYVRPHTVAHPHDIPNDPYYSVQWALEMIKAPDAWDVEKGQQGIRIAIIDTNFSRSHPDLRGRFDELSLNVSVDPPNDELDPAPGTFSSHGTAVMGVAAANTDNGIGIAGLCWQGVTVVAYTTTRVDGGLPRSSILRALQRIVDNARRQGNQVIHVLNMSYGSFVPDPQERDLIRRIYEAGVVPVASAGNESINLPIYPSDYEGVVRVSAVGPTGDPASYTNYERIDLAAPGGDMQASQEEGVLSTEVGERYEFTQGTSFSSPYVAAAIALLISAGAPVHTPVDPIPPAQEVLQETADTRGRVAPDPYLGWGIINVGDAIRGFSGAIITIIAPATNSIIDTRRARVHVQVRRSSLSQIRLFLDGEEIPRSAWEPYATVDEERKRVTIFGYEIIFAGEGRFEFTVTAVGEDGVQKTATSVVIVRPFVQPAGIAMFATPYRVNRAPEEIFGAEAVLARYLPSQNRYARYSGAGVREPEASFNPPGVNVRPEGSPTPTPPRGLGYFLRSNTPASIIGDEFIDPNTAYLIPLEPGWNMIGNPFPYSVPWSACEIEVEGQAGVRKRLNILEAADQGYIRPQIYRYITLTGEYTWRTAPLGELRPWEAHWIRAYKPCTLIVPPLGTQRSRDNTADNPRVDPSTRDGWLLRLIARSGNREDGNNFIGVSTRARDEVDSEDVEKPPSFQSYVQMRLIEPRSRTTLAQDLRRSGQRRMRWELEVATDKPHAEVTLHWQQELPLPRGLRLTLIDNLTGQRVSMNHQSAYTFRTSENSYRRFTIEAQPGRLNQLRITNANIISSRGNQITIQYALNAPATVQAIIQDSSGRIIARLSNGTRAAGLHTLTWTGRTDAGVAVPPGVYQVQLIATNEEGEIARLARPLLITR